LDLCCEIEKLFERDSELVIDVEKLLVGLCVGVRVLLNEYAGDNVCVNVALVSSESELDELGVIVKVNELLEDEDGVSVFVAVYCRVALPVRVWEIELLKDVLTVLVCDGLWVDVTVTSSVRLEVCVSELVPWVNDNEWVADGVVVTDMLEDSVDMTVDERVNVGVSDTLTVNDAVGETVTEVDSEGEMVGEDVTETVDDCERVNVFDSEVSTEGESVFETDGVEVNDGDCVFDPLSDFDCDREESSVSDTVAERSRVSERLSVSEADLDGVSDIVQDSEVVSVADSDSESVDVIVALDEPD
jgi:hypothetical protein